MFSRLSYCLGLVLISTILFAQEDLMEPSIFADESIERENTIDFTIGLNTFPQELLGMVEYLTDTGIAYFVSMDFGYEDKYDEGVLFESPSGPIVDVAPKVIGDRPYYDVAMGIGYYLSNRNAGLGFQLGIFSRVENEERSTYLGALARVNYKVKLGEHLVLMLGAELDFVKNTSSVSGVEVSKFPEIHGDLFLVRVGYRF